MSPEQLAKAKAPGKTAQEATRLAHTVFSGSTGDSERAAKELRNKFGDKEARNILETERVRNGAKPGLLRRLFS
jgi:hypothetical protein